MSAEARNRRAFLESLALLGVMAAVLAVLALGRSPAESAFPGANGKIAFESIRDGDFEIFVMNADGTDQTNLTNNTALDTEPDWSPDGTRIAFTSFRDGDFEIFVMDADGSNQTNHTNNTAEDTAPAWSPDGTKFAFGSRRDE